LGNEETTKNFAQRHREDEEEKCRSGNAEKPKKKQAQSYRKVKWQEKG